jgi:hypothetical protein
MSMFESKGLSINVYSPLWQGKKYIQSLQSEIDAWRHSTRAKGGYWDGSMSMRANWQTAMDWLTNGLGRHVELKDEALEIIWEGVVDTITITSGLLSVSIGPLTEMANRVIVTYSELDTSIEPGIPGPRTETDAKDNFASQERYGILESVQSVGAITSDIADQLRDLYLLRHAWPEPHQDISTTDQEQNIIVGLKGYVHFLDKTRYSQTADGGFITIEEKIASAVMAENNNLFEMTPLYQMKELCVNGSFEVSGAGGADLFASWTETASDGTIARVTTDNKTGSVCLSLTAGASVDTQVYETIAVQPRKAYVLTFWVRDLSTETATGVHDGGDGATYLTDSDNNFKEAEVKVGQILSNTTDGSTGTISAVDKTIVKVKSLTGGAQNDFDNGDVCTMLIGAYQGRYRIYDVTNGANIVATTNTSRSGSNQWHRVRKVFYTPAGCTSIRIYLYCPSTDTKQAYFDAVSLREYVGEIGEHGTYVNAYEDDGQSCWSVINELLAVGDWENKMYLFGVYADRQIRFETAPETVQYFLSPLSNDQRYYDRSGVVTSDWAVKPGNWLALSGFMIGEDIDVNRYTDPRIAFIDEVRYSMDLGLTVNTNRMNKFNHLLAKSGLKVEE